jgi:ATP-dependent DNA helicase DinG
MNVLDLRNIFGEQGPLSKVLPYFEFRPSQIEYGEAVQQALSNKKIALLEAQTGTGKTLAYLIPALQTGRRVLISTGTKALQEQLVFKDIPLLREKLGMEFDYVLMKGRMNYLCLLKQERVQNEPMLTDEESVEHFEHIQKWAASTETGDLAESGIPENAAVWKQLTISADACLGSKCRFHSPCYVFRLKQRAEEARIIVVNHHLFFADLSLQIMNSTSIFPPYDIVVFDEAHQLADVATHNLSITFSERAFAELYEDLTKELKILRHREKVETGPAQDRARKLGESISSLFAKFTTVPQKVRYDKNSITKIVENHQIAIDRLYVALLEEIQKYVEKTEDMPQIFRRIAASQSSLGFLLQASEDSYVYWAERNEHRQWSLQGSPLDVSDVLAEHLWPKLHSAILTSATLFVDQNCEPVKEELGLASALEHCFPYNFDYGSQACMYIPKHLPEPTDPNFAEEAAQEICELVEMTEGGAFVLCTSYGNLRIYERELRKLEYPLLVQGSRSKQAILKSFTRNKGSVLLATMSFWQGIDVQGDTLVSVIIDKLPFAVPSDPLIEAKILYLKKHSRNPFFEYQLPAAVMMLKQGIGRLIRTSVDYGLLAVLDRRLVTKNYGEVFLRNLPKMPILHKLDDLKTAFEERKEKFLQYHQSI